MSDRIELPRRPNALRDLARRGALALGLVLLVALAAYLLRNGFVDAEEGEITLLDALYYALVSVTGTGYGDIRPVTPGARLAYALVVTPATMLFLILLVSTTVELLAEQTRRAVRERRWRATLHDHLIICGFGAKGRAALRTLLDRGVPPNQVVVIDPQHTARADATAAGATAIAGDASRSQVLQLAEAEKAKAIIVSPERDDAAVLITLTARQLAPDATIVSGAREEENAKLLRQSGADSVVVSSGTAGRLLGLASEAPRIADVLEDLFTVGQGLDLTQRVVRPEEAGPIERLALREPVLAVIRDGVSLRFDDPRAQVLQSEDCVVLLHSRAEPHRPAGT
jgi:voltage-gated potassium channel